jgi:hypothetical protein
MTATNRPLDEHRHDHAIEDVLFLMQDGLAFELACARVGRTPDSMERLFYRRGMTPPNMRKERL